MSFNIYGQSPSTKRPAKFSLSTYFKNWFYSNLTPLFNWLPIFSVGFFVFYAKLLEGFRIDPTSEIPANYVPFLVNWEVNAAILFGICWFIKGAFIKLFINYEKFRPLIVAIIYSYALWCQWLLYGNNVERPVSVTILIFAVLIFFTGKQKYKDIYMRGAKLDSIQQVRAQYEQQKQAETIAYQLKLEQQQQ